ncbi:YSIRK-type signal peptide-containing protein [Lactobacillus intestinalis]|uniref:YSIRK-type signal peptide-containing protein n=1 Tax=Lactobacillus intestinalis TaxID=151781 RepID=UPI001F59E672|nr:YSIRK-type signal peptide-containing protein [Lactobacillus intestinalis]
MIPKNNIKERIRKMDSQREHHAIRKLTTGAASVLIGLTFMGTTGRSVKAATGNENSEAGIELEVKANNTDTSQLEVVSQETTQNNPTSEVTTEMPVAENTEAQTTDQTVTQNDTATETPAQNEAATSQIQENTEATTSHAAETTAPVASQTENNTEVATETAPVQNSETVQSQITKNTNSVENQTNTVTTAKNNNQVESQPQNNVNTENITVDNSTNEQQVAEKVETTPEVPAPSAPKADTEVSDKVVNLGETGDKELTTDDKVKHPNKDKVENDNIIDLNAADTEGKVVISATDPNNYPTDAGKLVGDDKYIYQIVTLNGTSSRLILAINRNDHNDESIYAYVTNNGYSSTSQTFEIKVGDQTIITVGNNRYQVSNTGKSDVVINDSTESTGNSSTITGESNNWSSDTISPIYGLGNTTDGSYSASGEIIPVYTENSVIKYYYKDKDGKLIEIEGSD